MLESKLRARTTAVMPGADALVTTTASAGAMRCRACAHRCVVADGRSGACSVRYNEGGRLHVPFGYVARRYLRSIETNTIFHVLPGAPALTFGMWGCDLRCGYCHNWRLSQALRDGTDGDPIDISAEALVDEAISGGARVICAAYNEPMISAEWAFAVFTEGRRRGLVTALVTDGNSTAEALAFMRRVTDVLRVDLKAATEAAYHQLGGRLAPVLDTIAEGRRMGFWVEVVTLVVPALNDNYADLARLADTVRDISPDIPWHLNAFQPRYRLAERPVTAAGVLLSAAGTAYARGLRFVYVGNTAPSPLEHTRCPECHQTVVHRSNYRTLHCAAPTGQCPGCGTQIPGIWEKNGPASTTLQSP